MIEPELKDNKFKRLQSNSTEESVMKNREKELKCIIGIFRHSERTPKQKIKFKIDKSSPLFEFAKGGTKITKIKNPNDMKRVTDVVNE